MTLSIRDRNRNQDYTTYGPHAPRRPSHGTEDTATAPDAPSYSPFDYMSDNNTTVAMGQILGMEFALQQSALDRDMQHAASLELGLEKLDTNLQMSKMNAIEQMSAEENHHIEKMTQIKQKHAALESSGPRYIEIAPPEFFTDSF